MLNETNAAELVTKDRPICCRIQWVDDSGNATPDRNSAVGTVVCVTRRGELESRSQPIPICAEHLKRMPREPWRATDHGPQWIEACGEDYVMQWEFTPCPTT